MGKDCISYSFVFIPNSNAIHPRPSGLGRGLLARSDKFLSTLFENIKAKKTLFLAELFTAKLFAEDLGHYLDGEPIQARPTSWIYRAKKRAKKQKSVLAVAAAALIVIIAVIASSLYSRWVTAEQARLLYLFGQQMKEAETHLRSAYLLPLHDTKPDRDRIREQIKSIESQMERMGRVATGPGHYAISRGYFALRENKLAREHLDKAWQGGYRTPEVANSLWEVLDSLYMKELLATIRIYNKELREARIKEIEKAYLEPAQEYLKAGGGLQIKSPEYKEALIAFYKEEYEDALKKASRAFEKTPSLYEAKILQSEIYQAVGYNKLVKGDYEGALEDYRHAGKESKLALEMARSDPALYEEEARRLLTMMYIEITLRHSPQQTSEQALSACDKALLADREREVAYILKSQIYTYLSHYQAKNGEDYTIALNKSVEMAQNAIHINQSNSDAYYSLGYACINQGSQQYDRGLDPRPSLLCAIDAFQNAVQIAPNYSESYRGLGNAYFIQSEYETRRGLDPGTSLLHSIESYQKAIQISPNHAHLYSELGRAYLREAEHLLKMNQRPEKELEQGFEMAERSLSINPQEASAVAIQGALFLLQARVEKNSTKRGESAQRAQLLLGQALKMNSSLQREYEPLLTEARKLTTQSTNTEEE